MYSGTHMYSCDIGMVHCIQDIVHTFRVVHVFKA